MRRRFGLLLAFGLLTPLAIAASASAQGTVIQMVPQTVSPGQVVRVTGGGFNTAAGANPVNIRLRTRDGQIILAGANLDTRGQLDNAQFPFPNVAPGIYLVIATQTYANGRQVAFTPGRTRIRVVAASAAAAGTGGPGGPGGWLMTAGALALLLLVAGLTLTARKLRTPARPTSATGGA